MTHNGGLCVNRSAVSESIHHYLSCSSLLQQTIQIGYQFGRIGCRHARRGGAGGREGGFELLSGGCRPDKAARNESFGDFRLVVKNGRASCRERVCQYGWIPVGGEYLNKQEDKQYGGQHN